ncbi:MAG: hypothetical protein ABWX57_11175, partial [Aeromicrobium sp.]
AVTYQWLRSGTPIAGATGTSYVVPVADLGAPISVRATGTKVGFSEGSVTSASTAVVAAAPQARGKVRITGEPKVGRTLKARLSGFDAGTTVSYRWLVGDKVRGTKSSLKLTGKMVGKRVVLRVVVTRPGHQTITVASKATDKVKAVKKPKKPKKPKK